MKYKKPKYCTSKLPCSKTSCRHCEYNKYIMKHLEEDIKESEKSIKEDKELEKTLGKRF